MLLLLGLFLSLGGLDTGGRTAAKERQNAEEAGRRRKAGKANDGTAGSRCGKANGIALREAGREAGKRKRVNSARGWTVDKSGKNDKRSRRGTLGRRLHGGKGAAKGRRSGAARDHKRYGKKIENQSAAHGNRAARKAEIERGREVTKGETLSGRESASGKGGGAKSLLFCGSFYKNGELLFYNSFIFHQGGEFAHKKGRSGGGGLTRCEKSGAGKWLRFALVLRRFVPRWGRHKTCFAVFVCAGT